VMKRIAILTAFALVIDVGQTMACETANCAMPEPTVSALPQGCITASCVLPEPSIRLAALCDRFDCGAPESTVTTTPQDCGDAGCALREHIIRRLAEPPAAKPSLFTRR